MAIAPTGDIYKAFSFDNTSSRNFGVYITGSAVYNAPERDVEMVTVPGRNGNLVVDNGRFENIEVTYPAGIFAETEADFAQAISDLRNFLCSRKGYCRLTDEYNPDEYRLGIYKSGLEVEPSQLKAGEFELIFDCKPQRFLTSGEEEVDVLNPVPTTIINPTLFDSQPLLEIWGYGDVSVNGYDIQLNDEDVGTILLMDAGKTELWYGNDYSTLLVDNGDTITLNGFKAVHQVWRKDKQTLPEPTSITYGTNHDFDVVTTYKSGSFKGWMFTFTVSDDFTFTAGTDAELKTDIVVVFGADATNHTGTITIKLKNTVVDSGTQNLLIDTHLSGNMNYFDRSTSTNYWNGSLYADSTQSVLGNPTYIDMELGEAYKVVGTEYVSINQFVALGSDLAVLNPGENSVSHSYYVTGFKIVPRWWKV